MESPNFDFYIFGKKGKLDLHNKSDENKLLHGFAAKSHVKSQMTVYRKDPIIYYVYIRKLSKTDNFLGVCLKFNGVYCTDNKKIFDLFEEAIESQIIRKEKILKTDLDGNTDFITDDFSRNRVEIENLENYLRNKVRDNFQQNFPSLDNSFGQESPKQQFISFQDDQNDINNTIKKYKYVTITTERDEILRDKLKFGKYIINKKHDHKSTNWICAIIFLTVLIILIFGLVHQSFSIYIVFILEIPLVMSLYYWFFEKFTKGKNELFLAFFSFIFSVLGVALTVDGNVFSQSDGDYINIIKRSFNKEASKDVSNSLNQWDSIPNLVFILDMSGSTKQKEYRDTTEANELFIDVCINLRADTVNVKNVLNNFLHRKKIYTDYDVYKLKILNILAQEQERYKDKIDIICFAGDVVVMKRVNCKTVIPYITNLESNKEFIGNNKTDFIKLIDKIEDLYANKSLRDISKAPKYTFLFFSDYLHDVGGNYSNKLRRKTTEEIADKINKFYCKQNFSNYFFASSSSPKNSNTEISILPIFEKFANKNSKAHFLRIEDEEYDFMDVLPKDVIPIYYENSYPISPLYTTITFNEIEIPEEVKMIWQTSPQNIVDYHHQISFLSKDSIPLFSSSSITISKDSPLILSFSGRIINNYTSTLLTFQSANHNCSRFDIVFFKDLPGFVRYIISVSIFSFYLCILSVILWFIYDKNTKIINK